MRLIFFIFSLSLSQMSFGGDCTSSDIQNYTSPITCDSLIVNEPVNFSPDQNIPAMEITVLGDVSINADISINGSDGFHATTDPSGIVKGGPGASEGGTLASGDGENGHEEFPFYDHQPSDGDNTFHDVPCDHGGGGAGGFDQPGEDGELCTGGPSPVATGGIASGFPSPFRGGFGGSAGAAYPDGSGGYDVGTGGAGGGGLYINASGSITIKNGVRISARGGRGGNSIERGGAGGGGGGGFIWFRTPGLINNKGIFDTRGGDGGINTYNGSPKGGNGGKGADGVFRTQINGVITDRIGLSSFASNVAPLKSNISCGTIVNPNDDHVLMRQLLLTFALMILLFKILSRFRKTV